MEDKNIKKIVLVEDKPWKVRNQILEMKSVGIQTETVLFFSNMKRQQLSNRVLEWLVKFETAIGQQVRFVGNLDFNQVLDEYYSKSDVVIVMDLGLIGDGSKVFSERINVRYAKSKDEKDRIWFYTVGSIDQEMILRNNFSHHVIDADTCENEQIEWDKDQIKKIVNK